MNTTKLTSQLAWLRFLVIGGDDIGWQNVGAYGLGTMGHTPPNLDRIGTQAIKFTDHYAQAACTPGRAAFSTGQDPIRSGLTTVGVPGDKLGLQTASPPCLAEVLQKAGYRTGQFGKTNLRSDPNESYDNNDSAGHLEQRVSWRFQPMSERVQAHLKTLIEYSPVQDGTSFDMSNAVEEVLRRAKHD